MNIIGNFLLFLSLIVSIWSCTLSLISLKSGKRSLYISIKRGIYAFALFAFSSLSILFFSVLSNDLSLKITASYSQAGLPVFYKIAGVLVSETGFVFVWAVLLSIMLSFVSFKERGDAATRYRSIILLFLSVYFLFMLNFIIPPFALSPTIPPYGRGLHPSLQYPFFMATHTVLLLFGYLGFTYIFSYYMAALITKSPDDRWIYKIRRHIVLCWLSLFFSLLAGSYWAHLLDNWGGYWSFDIVQNVSLLPILFSAALLHSIILQEKRGMLRIWNASLISLIFNSILFATYIARSSKFASSHFFSHSDSSRYFLLLFLISSVLSTIVIIKRVDYLKGENTLESFLSRESGFLLNNLLFFSIAFVIIWGISFYAVSSLLGKGVTLSFQYFHKIVVPIAFVILLLTAFCPILGWKKTSKEALRKGLFIFFLSLIIAIVIVCLCKLSDIKFILTMLLTIFTLMSVSYESFLNISFRRESGISLFRALYMDRKKYGGYIVHIGILCIFIGITASGFRDKKTFEIEMNGEGIDIGGYRLKYKEIEDDYTYSDTKFTLKLNLYLNKGDKVVDILKPSMEIFRGWEEAYARGAVYSTFAKEVQVKWRKYDTSTGSVTVDVYICPYIKFIWLGGGIVMIGTLITLTALFKNKKAYQLLAYLLIILSLSNPLSLYAAENPSQGVLIKGAVILKGREGMKPLGDIEITLNKHSANADDRFKLVADKEGRFLFNLIEDNGTVGYYVTTEYKGVSYSSDMVTRDDTSKEITLMLYEPTTEMSNIYTYEHSINVVPDLAKKKFLINETIRIENKGEEIFVGAKGLYHNKREVFRITPPRSFKNIKPTGGMNQNSSFINEDGILDVAPVKPGKKDFVLSYEVGFDSDIYKLEWEPYFNTKKLKIYIKNIGIKVNSEAIKAASHIEELKESIPDSKGGHQHDSKGTEKSLGYFILLEGKDIAAGEVIDIKISGLVNKEFDMRILSAGVFLVFLAAVGIKRYFL